MKETLAEFLTERLHTPKAIEGKNLNFQAGTFCFVIMYLSTYTIEGIIKWILNYLELKCFPFFTKGVSTLLESLAFALADPGDVFVIMFPSYPRFRSDISERAEIKLMGPALRAENDFMLRWINYINGFLI